VTLLPCGTLAYFPLHALADEQGGCLIDDVPVRYAPTARTLLAARDRLERQAVGETRFLGVGNPTRDLPAAEPEVSGIATLFPPRCATILLSDRATFDMVRQSLEGVTILHLACHGQLFLARGERLTLRTVLDDAEFGALRAARLAVLSACESARADLLGLPEEALGFPAAFVQAGVAGVVGTLWPVADLSTALLMLRFYQGLIHGRQAPATALREAQQWLRAVTRNELDLVCVDVPELRKGLRDFFDAEVNGERAVAPASQPFADPYFWAGFILVGV
jgi:CHAT domain-containing protein